MATAIKAIPAAGYVRMSSDKQETSPAQQRREIERYAAKNGYAVVRWYSDEGISGDDTARRVGFKTMIGDVATGEFEAVLCWDQDRFGRFDMIEAGKWISPLREAGVHLATVTQGRIDWTDLAGRMMYGIVQEFKNQYLRDLSKNVTRGMADLARDGKWAGGTPPLGYVVGPDQKLQLGEPEDVELVRWIFEEYRRGHSIRGIADQLSQMGKLSPKGTRWTSTGIRGLLHNPTYQGHLVWNRLRMGRYKRKPKQGKRRDESEWITIENSHPAIIPPAVFQAVQDKLAANRGSGVSHRWDSEYVLSGLLICGGCGQRMQASKENGVHNYVCYSYRQNGSCQANRFRQDFLLDGILRTLREQYFNEDTLSRLREAMRRILSDKDRPMVQVQRSHVEETERKLTQAKRRLVEVDADMVPIVQERIRELSDQLGRQRSAMKTANKPAGAISADLDQRIKAAIERFAQLEQWAKSGDTVALREMLRKIVARVEIYADKIPLGTRRHRYELRRAVIYFHGINPDIAGGYDESDGDMGGGSSGPPLLPRHISNGLLEIEWVNTAAA